MTDRLFVKPAVAGAMMRQPDRDMRPLDQNGEWVPATNFWRSRLLNGDVVEIDPPAESVPPAPKPLASTKAPAAAKSE